MEFTLRQHGRAARHFIADLLLEKGRLKTRADAALADSPTAAAFAILTEHNGTSHGRVAAAAFDEVRDELGPKLKALEQGPTRIEPLPGERRQILSVLPRTDYRRIFEIGSSSGHYTQALADTFPQAEIWGCDPPPRMLEQAQRAASERGHA